MNHTLLFQGGLWVAKATCFGLCPCIFAAIIILDMEIGQVSPPFGIGLFVMKGVAPQDATMGDIYWAGFPFIACGLIVMALIVNFPALAPWLPGVMAKILLFRGM